MGVEQIRYPSFLEGLLDLFQFILVRVTIEHALGGVEIRISGGLASNTSS